MQSGAVQVPAKVFLGASRESLKTWYSELLRRTCASFRRKLCAVEILQAFIGLHTVLLCLCMGSRRGSPNRKPEARRLDETRSLVLPSNLPEQDPNCPVVSLLFPPLPYYATMGFRCSKISGWHSSANRPEGKYGPDQIREKAGHVSLWFLARLALCGTLR